MPLNHHNEVDYLADSLNMWYLLIVKPQ